MINGLNAIVRPTNVERTNACLGTVQELLIALGVINVTIVNASEVVTVTVMKIMNVSPATSAILVSVLRNDNFGFFYFYYLLI